MATRKTTTSENNEFENSNIGDILSKIDEMLEQDRKSFHVSSFKDDKLEKMDTLTKTQTNEILIDFAKKSSTDTKLAMIGIAALVQGGGTNASIPPFTRTVNGIKFDLKTLREVVKYHTDQKGTVRQLAKTLRDQIYKIALTNEWQGPLAKTLIKEYPDKFKPVDLYAAAEFHEDNPAPYITNDLRTALSERSKKQEELRLLKPQQKKGKKGGKRSGK
jgi:hypothetical protein